jgi:hypothetical protein
MRPRQTPPGISFAAYTNYIRAIGYVLDGQFGSGARQLATLATAMQSRPAYQSIQRRGHARPERVAGLLNIAWQTELALNLPRLIREEHLASVTIHWGTIQLYYAVHCAACAWLEAMEGPTAPDSHRAALRALSHHASVAGMFPLPWGLACRSCAPVVSFCGEIPNYQPSPVNVLATPGPGNALDYLCLALKKTREWQLGQRVDRWKRDNKRLRISPMERSLQDGFSPTTVFDFFWKLRLRINYQDAEFFTVAHQYPTDAVRYHRGLCQIAAASLLVFEKLVAAAYGRGSLASVAKKLLDRSDTSKQTVGQRVNLW